MVKKLSKKEANKTVKNIACKKGKIHYKGVSPAWNARFGTLHKRLSPENACMFKAMSLKKKKVVVSKLVKKGYMR